MVTLIFDPGNDEASKCQRRVPWWPSSCGHGSLVLEPTPIWYLRGVSVDGLLVCTDLWVGVVMTCAYPLSWTKPPSAASPLGGRMLNVIDIPQNKPWLYDHMLHGLWVRSKWHFVFISTILKLTAKRIQLNLAETRSSRWRRHGAHWCSYTDRVSSFSNRKWHATNVCEKCNKCLWKMQQMSVKKEIPCRSMQQMLWDNVMMRAGIQCWALQNECTSTCVLTTKHSNANTIEHAMDRWKS